MDSILIPSDETETETTVLYDEYDYTLPTAITTVPSSPGTSQCYSINTGGGGGGGIGTWNTWASPYNSTFTVNTTTPTPESLKVEGKITASDIELDGVSMKEMMQTIQDRLGILVPDPAKLEKYEALKKAYEDYKILEKLVMNDE